MKHETKKYPQVLFHLISCISALKMEKESCKNVQENLKLAMKEVGWVLVHL